MAQWIRNYFSMIGCVSIALSSVKFAIISKSWAWNFQTQRYRSSQHSTTAPIMAHHAIGNKNVVTGIWDRAKTLSMSTLKSKTYLEAEVLSINNIKIKTTLPWILKKNEKELLPAAVELSNNVGCCFIWNLAVAFHGKKKCNGKKNKIWNLRQMPVISFYFAVFSPEIYVAV